MSQKKDISDFDSYLGYWLRFVSNQSYTAFNQGLSKHDISVAEWIAMRHLFSNEPCSLTQIVEMIGIDKGAVSRMAMRLEKRHFITREEDAKDRRISRFKLTKAGRDLVPVLAKLTDEIDDHFYGHLSERDRNSLFRILKGLVKHHGFKATPID